MKEFLKNLGIRDTHPGAGLGTSDGWLDTHGAELLSMSPIDGTPLARVRMATAADYETLMDSIRPAAEKWRLTPAPKRGEIIREIGCVLRQFKEPLARLVTLETGKILEEGRGEVQEMIDIGDFAVGLSRQLFGLTIHSERPAHRMYEQWHPLGIVGVITSFNFPVAVWSWNALIAAVCGDVILWKPSSKTPLTAIAVQNLISQVLDRHKLAGVFSLIVGRGSEIGDRIAGDRRIPLVSATGSCAMGRRLGETVARRLGRSLLELGGNNAIIIAEDADLDLALDAVLFSDIGTTGQRCTSARRLIVHRSVRGAFLAKLIDAYEKLSIGNPLEPGVHMGPLIDGTAREAMMAALEAARQDGATILYGGRPLQLPGLEGGHYVQPAIVATPPDLPVMKEETFAPILYVVEYDHFEEALAIHNNVDQGLSSAVITRSLHLSEEFLSARGSDCGLAYVNLGTIGAEIGGAFGGEKDTGGGRESGSDAWKAYMRRQTVTINWSRKLQHAQGIHFDVSE